MKPEMKRVIYANTAATVTIRNLANLDAQLVAGNTNASLIWTNNGTDTGGFRWFPSPQAGSAENQMEGTRYVMIYAEVSFILYPLANSNTEWADSIRIILVKERQKDIPLTGATNGIISVLQFVSFVAPIRSKVWDIQYDKTITYTTGLTTNNAAGTNNHTSTAPRPIRYRMIIPLKTKLTGPNLLNNLFPLRLYLYAFTDRTDSTWTMRDVSAIYYYRDP